MDIYQLIPEKQSMMKEVVEQKRLKAEQQKLIDDAIKGGPYFNKGQRQLIEKPAIEIAPTEVTSTEVTEPQSSQESEGAENPNEEAA